MLKETKFKNEDNNIVYKCYLLRHQKIYINFYYFLKVFKKSLNIGTRTFSTHTLL